MRFLITGAAGFIGSALAERLLAREDTVHGIDNLNDYYDIGLKKADALALVTEWKPFRNPDFELIKKVMRTPIIFDGRNQYDPQHVRGLGFEFFGIGR